MGVSLMYFSVPHLKRLSKAARSLDETEGRAHSAKLHRRQRPFCQIIDRVGMDPRCVQAHRFCTMFCALAIEHAERVTGSSLPGYPGHVFQQTMGFMARGEEAEIGRRACGYPGRIRHHVLVYGEFDEDDSRWLCTTISGFLYVVQTSEHSVPVMGGGACSKRVNRP